MEQELIATAITVANLNAPRCLSELRLGVRLLPSLSTEKSLQCSSPPLIKPAAAQTSALVSLAAARLAVAFCISSSVLILPAFVTTKKRTLIGSSPQGPNKTL